MRVAIASDHRGFLHKSKVLALVEENGHEPVDFGPETAESVDYPDYGGKVAAAVSSGDFDRGILICGTGIGMCIVANKYPGVRAADCHDELAAQVSRMHNDSNVLCLSADLVGERILDRIIEVWLSADFEGGRHERRLNKIKEIEAARADS